jgi:hypothetical protein
VKVPKRFVSLSVSIIGSAIRKNGIRKAGMQEIDSSRVFFSCVHVFLISSLSIPHFTLGK